MIDHKECRLGVCPIGKFAFSHEDAKVQKNAVMDKLRELGVDLSLIHIFIVMHDGRITGELNIEEATQERILEYAIQ